jgi:hypothetical protein
MLASEERKKDKNPKSIEGKKEHIRTAKQKSLLQSKGGPFQDAGVLSLILGQ